LIAGCASHWYYDVHFDTPSRTLNHQRGAVFLYLQLYSATKKDDLGKNNDIKQAIDSQNTHKATITSVNCIPCEPTEKDPKDSIPLSKDKLDLVLSSTATHPGLTEILDDGYDYHKSRNHSYQPI